MLIGEKIRNARVHVGMTQSDLADKLKCSEKTISRIEHNKKELTLEEVKHINEIFGIDLLVEEDDKLDSKTDNLANDNITLSIDCIKEEIIRVERRRTQKIVLILVLLFIVVFLAYCSISDWVSPRDSRESIVVEYIYVEGE